MPFLTGVDEDNTGEQAVAAFFEGAARVAYARAVRSSIWSVAVLAFVVGTNAASARADELLRGPYPFLHDNELSLHGGYAAGLGDTFAGPKASIDYGYRIYGGLWLDLDAGYLSGVCRPRDDGMVCARKGDSAEVLAGIKWKLRMNIPLVPYAKALGGLAYQFPDAGSNALGPLLRAGLGATYFLYDWFGVGAEVTTAIGHAGYDQDVGLAKTLGGLDATLGVELQF